MSDDEEQEEFVASDDADAEDFKRVSYGEFLDLVYMPPTLKERLLANDNQKAFSLNFLVLPYTLGASVALDALLSDAEQLMYAAEEIGKSPQKEFARRMLQDIEDAIESMFSLRGAPVMDVCRDLMELTMLFRDFFSEPQRLPAWVRADMDRRKDFSFRRLVDKYADDLMYMGSNDPAALKREYQGHSRTLHPAMFFKASEELTRGRLDDASEGFTIFMLASHTTEIVRHGAAAIAMFAFWFMKDNPKRVTMDSLDLEVLKENSAYDQWMTDWERYKLTDPEAEAEYNDRIDQDGPKPRTKKPPSDAGASGAGQNN